MAARSRHACNTCGESFSTAFNLQRHMYLKHDLSVNGFLRCESENCSFRTACKTKLKDHQLKHQEAVENHRFICSTCDKSYRCLRSLQNHIRAKHPANTVISCRTCRKEFSSVALFRVHSKQHDGEDKQAFKCDVCQRVFTARGNLRRHMSEQHSGKPNVFHCDQCGKAFPRSYALRRHQESHVPDEDRLKRVCTKCGNLFVGCKHFKICKGP